MGQKEVLFAFNELKPVLTGMLEQAGIPGCAAKIVFENGDSDVFTWGSKERGIDKSPDENTIFMIGSCSKTFTALAAAIMGKNNQADLDAPVSNLVPFELKRNGIPISLRHLLTNSSGLPNLGLSEIITGKVLYKQIPGDYADSYPFEGENAFLKFMQNAGEELIGSPGEQYIYSNEGFSLAGEALGIAANKPFQDVVNDLIFQTLGMQTSGFRKSDFPPDADFATGHIDDGSSVPVYFEPSIAGAGGILSSAKDMGKFILALLNQGKLKNQQVLPASVIQEIEQGRINHDTASSLVGPGFGPEQYGMGMMIYPDFLGSQILTHGGSTGNFSSSIYYSRDLGFGIASLCNGAGGEGLLALFAFMLTAMALGKDPFNLFPAFSMENALKALEGEYSSRGNAIKVRIAYRQGWLWWESVDQNKNRPGGVHPLISTGNPSNKRFRFINSPGAESEVIFFPGDNGQMKVKKDRNVLTRRLSGA